VEIEWRMPRSADKIKKEFINDISSIFSTKPAKKRGLRIWVARVFRDGARKWIHFSWRGQISIESC
jgi:hypothetical protein